MREQLTEASHPGGVPGRARTVTTLAQIADLHMPTGRVGGLRQLLNKRASGWIDWRLRRSRIFLDRILEALLADLHAQQPDHVVVTGDLVNLALEREFVTSAAWLRRLGSPSRVSVVPGNHDAYVAVPADQSWNHWAAYVVSDDASDTAAVTAAIFPTVRIRGDIAVIGLCSARPTRLLQATGTLGDDQLGRLDTILQATGRRGLCRVVQIHHPPFAQGTARRRRLTDAAALQQVLARTGAELVLHAHAHVTSFRCIDGPCGEIPVVGVRAASNVGETPTELAQYHVYRIEKRDHHADQAHFDIAVTVREWNSSAQTFEAMQTLSLGQARQDTTTKHESYVARSAAA